MNYGVFIFLIFFLAIGVLVPCENQSAEILWLEAESFEHTGGWVNDSQFVDVMGSPYLLAHGVGEPIDDAFTHVAISADDTYRLWIRCKDWLPEYSPGTFMVYIDGEPSQISFGQAEDDRWKWVDGGLFDLTKGEVEIRLHDLTGWWGRCDAVILSSDESFKPANDILNLEFQRIRYFDPYKQIEEASENDVVVVGGGLAGCAAAISAARHGCSVTLIQDRPILGGNASNEIKVPPAGDRTNEPFDPLETGIIEEFYPIPDRGRDHDWSAAMETVVRNESRIDLRLNTRAINVVMDDREKIEAILALDVHSGERLLFPGKIFIDCTGDGWIGFWAGAVIRQGREARSEFNETLAPETADLKTMGNALQVAKFVEGEPSSFESPQWAYNNWKSPSDFEEYIRWKSHVVPLRYVSYPVYSGEEELAHRFTQGSGNYGEQQQYTQPHVEEARSVMREMPVPSEKYREYEKGKGYSVTDRNGGFFKWFVEFGGMMDTIDDAEKIRDELLRINLGLWNYVKNYDPKFKEQNKKRKLTWITYVPGKRESRRLMGDYIMTQWEYMDAMIHPDNVAYSGWGIDLHHPNGFWTNGPMSVHTYRDRKISIPFRSLYSCNIENLMMAGRNISVSHVALGGVRVMRTTCLMGQAVGTAAGICIEKQVLPRDVTDHHIHDLQQRLLKDGCYLMGTKNTDPEDLARESTVSASSVKTIVDPSYHLSPSGEPMVHQLDTPRAVMFKPGKKRIDQIAFYLHSSKEQPTPIELTLRPADSFGDFSSQTNLAQAKAVVPPQNEGWISFPLNCRVQPDSYYYVFLPAQKGVSWQVFPQAVKDACRAYKDTDWNMRLECYAFTLDPEQVRSQEIPKIVLQPDNVIDGFNRAVGGVPHSWGPDSSQGYPQWIELQFDDRETFNTIYVSFQNYDYCCPKYRIDILDDDRWKTIVEVKNSEHRRRVFHFDPQESDRIRLILETKALKKNDSPQLCELRVYNEGKVSLK